MSFDQKTPLSEIPYPNFLPVINSDYTAPNSDFSVNSDNSAPNSDYAFNSGYSAPNSNFPVNSDYSALNSDSQGNSDYSAPISDFAVISDYSAPNSNTPANSGYSAPISNSPVNSGDSAPNSDSLVNSDYTSLNSETTSSNAGQQVFSAESLETPRPLSALPFMKNEKNPSVNFLAQYFPESSTPSPLGKLQYLLFQFTIKFKKTNYPFTMGFFNWIQKFLGYLEKQYFFY